jgi:hypothetical protein
MCDWLLLLGFCYTEREEIFCTVLVFWILLLKKTCFLSEPYPEGMDYKRQLDELIHVAGLCIELLQQNDEYHADVSRFV